MDQATEQVLLGSALGNIFRMPLDPDEERVTPALNGLHHPGRLRCAHNDVVAEILDGLFVQGIDATVAGLQDLVQDGSG